MRTRLQIEYLRLLDWTQVAGLVELKDGEDLPESLRTDRLTMVAILPEIRALLEDFAEINGQYIQLKPDDDSNLSEDGEKLDIVEEFRHLSLSYETTVGKRSYIRGFNRLAKKASMAKDIIKNPKQLKWVAFDAETFIRMLQRLTSLNDYLAELMRGSQARHLVSIDILLSLTKIPAESIRLMEPAVRVCHATKSKFDSSGMNMREARRLVKPRSCS